MAGNRQSGVRHAAGGSQVGSRRRSGGQQAAVRLEAGAGPGKMHLFFNFTDITKYMILFHLQKLGAERRNFLFNY